MISEAIFYQIISKARYLKNIISDYSLIITSYASFKTICIGLGITATVIALIYIAYLALSKNEERSNTNNIKGTKAQRDPKKLLKIPKYECPLTKGNDIY